MVYRLCPAAKPTGSQSFIDAVAAHYCVFDNPGIAGLKDHHQPLTRELLQRAADGVFTPEVKEKLHRLTRGKAPP